MRKKLSLVIAILCVLVMAGCSEADRVSYNVSKEADNFNVVRRLTVINTRSDECILQMTGKMSIESVTGGVAVMVELDRDKGIYQKHYIWMNDWTMYTLEDLNGVSVDKYAYELEFMPKMLVPVRITANEIKQDGDLFVSVSDDEEGEEHG